MICLRTIPTTKLPDGFFISEYYIISEYCIQADYIIDNKPLARFRELRGFYILFLSCGKIFL